MTAAHEDNGLSGQPAGIKVIGAPPREPLFRIWARRALTFPLTFVAVGLLVALMPLLLAVALCYDLVRRSDLLAVRFVLAVFVLLGLHPIGLIMLFEAFVRGGRYLGAPREREIRFTARRESWWANAMVRSAAWIYRMRVEIEGLDSMAKGPVLVFMRHSSILDTMLPLALVGKPFGKHIRYVMKHELVWNPCVDVVGHRIPMAFVKRSGARHAAEIGKVMSLVDNLTPDSLVVIYPEGTRFTPEKQKKRAAELARKDPEAAAWARSLKHVLPPQLGGALGLLARSEGVDVAFCAHIGMEGAATMQDWAGGALLDKTLKVAFFRVPAAEVPRGKEECVKWLYSNWERVDRWIEEQKASEGGGRRG